MTHDECSRIAAHAERLSYNYSTEGKFCGFGLLCLRGWDVQVLIVSGQGVPQFVPLR